MPARRRAALASATVALLVALAPRPAPAAGWRGTTVVGSHPPVGSRPALAARTHPAPAADPGPAAAGSTPAAARAALERARAASGGERWAALKAISMRARLRSGGLDGEVERIEDVRRGRHVTRYRLGPTKGASGFDGERAWTQDDAGQVRIEDGAEAREAAVNEAYRAALAFWFPERWPARIEGGGERSEGQRRFTLVRISPEGGRPFDLWIDAATGLVDRHTERDATRLRTVLYSAHREVDGLRLPFAIRTTTGDPRYDDHLAVASYALDPPLEDALFAPPPPPPPDFAIAGGRPSTTVPFELLNNHVYVDVRLNGKGPFRLLCDTGGANIVTPDLAKELGLEAQGALEGRGVGEKSEDVALARISRLELGEARLDDQLFAVFPLASLTAVEGVPVRGLVGYEVFKRFVVVLDYEGRALTLHHPATYTPRGRGVAVPFTFDGHTPQVEGRLDGIPGTFWLDTGSRGSLAIFGPFAEKHGLVERYRARTEAVTGWGVGGPARALLARAGRLVLGEGDGVVVEEPVIDISVQKKGAFTGRYGAGNVGGAILRRFTLTFDYGRRVVTFEPNAHAGERQVHDRSGLWLNLAEGGRAFEVMDVAAGGPGARAGLRAGDRIVAVDGRAAADLSLPAARERLRTSRPGTRVRLAVEPAGKGKRREVVLVLADLV